jgi:hypothetical protein
VHPPAGCLPLVSDYVAAYGHVAAASEYAGEALLQQCRVRAARYREHRQMHHELLLAC